MKKLESTFPNMFLTLLIVTAFSSLLASAVYNLTKEPIAEVARQKQFQAIQKVIPGFTELTKLAMMPENGKDSLIIFKGLSDGELIGIAIQTYTYEGYSGLIELIVGMKPDGTITTYEILQHKETPGLGSKISDPKFVQQFIGQNPGNFRLKVTKDGGDVDAITAATISSRAICDALSRAYQTYLQLQQTNN